MFLDPKEVKNVFIHVKHVDFRKGINGLGVYVKHEFGSSQEGKNVFIFCNRKKDKIKGLYWDDSGYALWQKVLEEEKFKWPKGTDNEIEISVKQLQYLLSGLNIDDLKPHKTKDPKAFF